MKKRSIVFVLIFFIMLPGIALFADNNKIPGTIYFEDGTTLDFFHFKRIDYEYDYIKVEYQNSTRKLGFDQLEYLKITIYKIDSRWLKEGDSFFEVKTKTGITLKNQDVDLISNAGLDVIIVDILDDLTGEVKTQKFRFVEDGKLNIRKIVFGSKKN